MEANTIKRRRYGRRKMSLIKKVWMLFIFISLSYLVINTYTSNLKNDIINDNKIQTNKEV